MPHIEFLMRSTFDRSLSDIVPSTFAIVHMITVLFIKLVKIVVKRFGNQFIYLSHTGCVQMFTHAGFV